ncbi:DinB family protein [Loktanella sp. S4079]|uniref:DinB family protein n=1 Tax=Loktanella sp. S4079 TaxID=579483 RepID=UPI0005FA37B8|nr:DinB family protein [Loktanella sp. S4079]KJZ20633.1 damage-inducible protein DinB [Loktanella sp. S4079]
MISTSYRQLMARYNRWQNTSLVTATNLLTNAERWQDRGAYFKSIAGTFNHLYWADALILERINGNERPQDTISHSLAHPSDWSDFKDLRSKRDLEIETWAAAISDAELSETIGCYPPDDSSRIQMQTCLCALQLFNHQTHHRGQIHAMLTAAGTKPEPSDITAMP